MSFEMLIISVEVGDAAHVEPVPELAGAHLHLALGHALFDQGLGHVLAQAKYQALDDNE